MDIKEILLNGGHVSFPYKEEPEEWVGSAKIISLSGGFGMTPKIIVEVPCLEIQGRKEYTFDEIDSAVEKFKELVFRKKNLMFKMHQAMLELHKNGETELDLDEDEDLNKVREVQSRLINFEIDDSMVNLENDPFFINKNNIAQNILNKVGLPND